MKKLTSTLALIFGLIYFAIAQQGVEIKGRVTGDNGVVISNAVVTFKEISSGEQTPVKADKEGNYTSALSEGKHVIKFSAPGYATKTVIVEVAGNTLIDMNLVKIKNGRNSRR